MSFPISDSYYFLEKNKNLNTYISINDIIKNFSVNNSLFTILY